MKTIASENIVPFDVDETLIEAIGSFQWSEKIAIKDPYSNKTLHAYVRRAAVRILMEHKARGSFIIVWSSRGYAWAEAVTEALGIHGLVDIHMTKPKICFDDQPIDKWCSQIHIRDLDFYG